MKIGKHNLDERVYVVAEIGNNHEGSFDVARKMVDAAAKTGVDAIKFQTFKTELFTGGSDAARLARLKGFELSQAQFAELAAQVRGHGLDFFSTPLDLESAKFLAEIVPVWKVASGDNDFYPLIELMADTGKPMIVSSGMTSADQIAGVVAHIEGRWKQRGTKGELAVLHCVSAYPAPDAEANLRAIMMLSARLDCTIGYSDHTMGPEASVAAVALGARIIEKHFTLDKNYSAFRDHQLSADPAEMAEIVRQIRRVETLLGKLEKNVQPSELPIEKVARRSIVAARDLPAGHRLEPSDLVWLRPMGGISPRETSKVVGRTLKQAIAKGHVLAHEELA